MTARAESKIGAGRVKLRGSETYRRTKTSQGQYCKEDRRFSGWLRMSGKDAGAIGFGWSQALRGANNSRAANRSPVGALGAWRLKVTIGSTCERLLWLVGTRSPIGSFLHHDMQEWIAFKETRPVANRLNW